MKVKTWMLWLLSSSCFLFVGIINIIYKEYLRGIAFTFIAVVYIGLSITYYKKDDKK